MSDRRPNANFVKSPCVGVCVMDDDDLCKGCYRTAEEITYWSTFDEERKREVVIRASKIAREKGMLL